jgi:hypothetical protein
MFIYNNNYLQILKIRSLFLNKYSTKLLTNKGVSFKKNYLKEFFLKLNNPSNKKLRFSGKGYKLIKRGINLNLYLNTSHNQ